MMISDLYDDGVINCQVQMDLAGDLLFHTTTSKWSPSIRRKAVEVFNAITDRCHDAGYNVIYTTVLEDHTPGHKLAKVFGFDLCGDVDGVSIYKRYT